jgi:hypothetical protein
MAQVFSSTPAQPGRAAAEDTVPQRIEEENKQANSDERPTMTLKEGCAGLTLNLG